jgi:hypothetical protein
MTIHPLGSGDAAASRPVQARPDTASAYDSTWAERPDAPSQSPSGLDRIMGTDGKLYVVLAVVLLIWFGLLTLLVRTDRKIDRLERRLDETSSDHDDRPGETS